jgi:hypothetical protein
MPTPGTNNFFFSIIVDLLRSKSPQFLANNMNRVPVHKRPAETHENDPVEGAGLVLDDSRSDVSVGLRGDEGSPDPPPSAAGCNTQHVSAISSRSNGQILGGILKTVVAKGDPALWCSV